MKHTFIQNQAYKVKTVGQNRAKTLYFNKLTDSWGENEKGEIVATHKVYVFSQYPNETGYNYYLTDELIETFEVAKPKTVKAESLKKCDRCNGRGRLEHVSHVMGGTCFKCGGSGQI